jgi:hypothetical protein
LDQSQADAQDYQYGDGQGDTFFLHPSRTSGFAPVNKKRPLARPSKRS